MKKVVFPVLIFVAAAVCAVAQDYRQKISANPAWAACEMCYYEPSESESTPAPKGYEPFYICHYGRHGSRYMSSSTETDAVRPVFEMAERCGLLQSNYVDGDGSKYDVRIVSLALSVGLAQIFHYYKEHNQLPETVSTWHTDYLRSTANCPIDNPVVVSKMEEITAGKKTDYEKAEAIFYYSLDEWEWINYSNTSRGAVKTIENKGGNCCDLSHAVVAIARAAGLPARYYHAQCKYKSSGKVIGHVMAQIYVDGKWYLCDPSSSGTTFGNHEAWSTMDTFNGLYNALPF